LLVYFNRNMFAHLRRSFVFASVARSDLTTPRGAEIDRSALSYGDSVWPASLQLATAPAHAKRYADGMPGAAVAVLPRRRRLRLPSGFPDITHCTPPDGRGFGFTRRDVPTARCAQPGSVDCKLTYGYRHVSMRRRRADSWEMHFGCGSRRPEAATLRSASMNRLACVATNLGHTSDLHAAH
jgi:hypothetical protein